MLVARDLRLQKIAVILDFLNLRNDVMSDCSSANHGVLCTLALLRQSVANLIEPSLSEYSLFALSDGLRSPSRHDCASLVHGSCTQLHACCAQWRAKYSCRRNSCPTAFETGIYGNLSSKQLAVSLV